MENFAKSRFEKGTLADPDRILVATDLNDGGYLLPHAAAQARASQAKVTLLYAVPPAYAFPVEAGAIPYADQAAVDREARLALLGLASRLREQGITCDTVARHGFAVDVIHDEIRRSGATRLMMGTHGRGRIGQMVLGSVANELLRTVEIPLFTVGPKAQNLSEHDRPRRILHPVSLIGDFAASAECAIDIAQTYRAELTLLHVVSPDTERGIHPEGGTAWAEKALKALVPDTMDLLRPIRTMVKCGSVVEETLRAAFMLDADWIVMGVDGRYPLRPFQESKAYRVLALAECPVLTVRHGQERKVPAYAEEARFAGIIG